MFEDDNGFLWVGTLADPRVRAIAQNHAGRLWIGTQAGIDRFDQSSPGEVKRFQHRPDDPTSLPGNDINALLVDRRERLWVGTARGLDEVLPNGQIRRHAGGDGLPVTRYFGILGGDLGQLWLSTSSGLWSYMPSSGKIRQFTANDGLQSEEFRPGAYERAGDGTLYFGGQNGLNFFRPEQEIDNPYKPLIALTAFKSLDGEDVPLTVTPFAAEELELSHQDRLFTLRFAALEFTHPEDNQYLYRLDPFNFDWVDGSDRTARYYQVPPGRYRFRVRAANGDGVWANHEFAVPLRLLPPFWQTWWWRLGFVSVGLLFLAGIYRFRTRQLRYREEELSRRVTAGLEDLRRSEQRYRSLFEHNLAGVLRADISGQLLDCNQAFAGMLGYSDPTECRQHRLNEHNDEAFASLIDQLREGEVLGYEQRLRHRDGDAVHLLWNAQLVEEPDRDAPILEATVIDISERRRIEEGLRRGQKLESLGVLAGGIAHDFNNILMGILGHTEIAKVQLPPDSPAWKSVIGIEKAADRAAGLANQMLAYSGKGRFQRERIDLSQVVEEVSRLLRPSLLRKARLRFELADDLPVVEGDPAQLDQVVLNLITNAIEAVAERTDAEVVVTTSCRRYEVEERDTQELNLSATGGKVLIIDDEEPVRSVTATMLEAFGYSPLTARDGREGAAIFAQHASEIELVLLDLTMPEMDGEETLIAIRKVDRNTPVILMSGYDDLLRDRQLEDLAISDFIKKPFRLQTLREKVRQLHILS